MNYILDQRLSLQGNRRSFLSRCIKLFTDWLKGEPEEKLITKTQLFIVPGYKFKIVQGLITNFHQPHSTLLLLGGSVYRPQHGKAHTHLR